MKITFRNWIIFKEQKGFALPSVLYMITILSLVILSIVMLKYFHQQNAVISIAQVKADYAAINGMNRAIVELNTQTIFLQFGTEVTRNFDFGPNGSASVRIQRWGLYFAMFSEGIVGRIKTQRVAMIADMPSSQFEDALYFANSDHQLVTTGTTKIKGNVTTGMPGVGIGSIASLPTPRTTPIEGKIKREKIPSFTLNEWKQHAELLKKLLKGELQISSTWGNVKHASSSFMLDKNSVSENINCIVVSGNVTISGSIKRTSKPLYVLCDRVMFEQGAELKGFIAILSREAIVIPQNISIQSALIYSHKFVQVNSNCIFSGQIFAPEIEILSGANLLYPSTVVSFRPEGSKIGKHGIILKNNSRVEGTVVLLTQGNLPKENTLINVEPGAKVVGTVVCEGAVTLDGNVDGAVLTKDFYFYQPPTTYAGWIRTGHINRPELPLSYLIPTGFSKSNKLSILEWL